MEKGKRICQALKELRKRIADANNIPFDLEECTHKGDCPGTCPKCESEVFYLMDSIDKLKQEGKPVALDGIMTEEELRKAFFIEHIEESVPEEEEMTTMGMLSMTQVGDMEPPLEGEPAPYPPYIIDSTIIRALLLKNKGNFVFSLAGLCSILEILQEGMDANSELYDQINNIIVGLNSEIEDVDDENFNLAHATSIWYDKAIGALKEDFLEYIKDVHNADARHAEFTQTTKTKLQIDKWVSDKTRQLIKSLNTELSKDVLMLVLNAIFLKAKWQYPFDPELTETDVFHNADGSESEVDMMHQDLEDVEYAETKEYQVINLPYKSYKAHMIVVLPKEGNDIDDIMSNSDWSYEVTEEREVELYMPRFKFDNTLSFKEILILSGLGDMFNKEDSFPNITDFPLHVSQIKQQCVINVEEEGTEAAAITIAECEVGCPPPDDIPQITTMRIDRPFGFAIRGLDNQFLFIGVVKDMNKGHH